MAIVSRPAALSKADHAALVSQLQAHALVIGDVVLSSGTEAKYLVDAKRMMLQPEGFRLLASVTSQFVRELGATAVGGLALGADAIACAALVHGPDDLKGFLVRKEPKRHGLQRRVEGPLLSPDDRCLIVDDVVTTGGSTVTAIEALQNEGLEICGVLAVLDRLAGGAEAIATAVNAPYVALTTIEDVYPDRPDREVTARR